MLRAWNQRLCNLRVLAALNVSSVAFRSIFLRSNDAPKRCTSSDFQEVVCRCTCQIWINPNSLSKCFTFQHISTMSLSRVFFCCWCILVYLVYYLDLSESSQFIHGLLPAPAVRPPLQLEHRPLPVSHNKISHIMSPWRKSPRNHQSQRTAPLLPSGVTGPVNSTLERRWKNPSHSWEKCQTLSLCGFPSFAFAILQSFPNYSLRFASCCVEKWTR